MNGGLIRHFLSGLSPVKGTNIDVMPCKGIGTENFIPLVVKFTVRSFIQLSNIQIIRQAMRGLTACIGCPRSFNLGFLEGPRDIIDQMVEGILPGGKWSNGVDIDTGNLH